MRTQVPVTTIYICYGGITMNNLIKFPREKTAKSLKKDDILRIQGSRKGQTISCEHGVVWITQEGDWVDRLLTPGEKFRTRIPGFVLLQAMSDSLISVSPQEKVEQIQDCRQPLQTNPACA